MGGRRTRSLVLRNSDSDFGHIHSVANPFSDYSDIPNSTRLLPDGRSGDTFSRITLPLIL